MYVSKTVKNEKKKKKIEAAAAAEVETCFFPPLCPRILEHLINLLNTYL